MFATPRSRRPIASVTQTPGGDKYYGVIETKAASILDFDSDNDEFYDGEGFLASPLVDSKSTSTPTSSINAIPQYTLLTASLFTTTPTATTTATTFPTPSTPYPSIHHLSNSPSNKIPENILVKLESCGNVANFEKNSVENRSLGDAACAAEDDEGFVWRTGDVGLESGERRVWEYLKRKKADLERLNEFINLERHVSESVLEEYMSTTTAQSLRTPDLESQHTQIWQRLAKDLLAATTARDNALTQVSQLTKTCGEYAAQVIKLEEMRDAVLVDASEAVGVACELEKKCVEVEEMRERVCELEGEVLRLKVWEGVAREMEGTPGMKEVEVTEVSQNCVIGCVGSAGAEKGLGQLREIEDMERGDDKVGPEAKDNILDVDQLNQELARLKEELHGYILKEGVLQRENEGLAAQLSLMRDQLKA